MGTSRLDGTIAGAVLRGQASLASLGTLAGLRNAAEALVAATAASGAPVLVQASPEAGALVGAAVMLGGGAVRAATAAEGAAVGKVMVVEAVAVSGLAVRRRVQELRASGADWVGVFVWRAERASENREADWGDTDTLLFAAAS